MTTNSDIWSVISNIMSDDTRHPEVSRLMDEASQRIASGESARSVSVETAAELKHLSDLLGVAAQEVALNSRQLLGMKDADFTEALGVGRSTFALLRKKHDSRLS